MKNLKCANAPYCQSERVANYEFFFDRSRTHGYASTRGAAGSGLSVASNAQLITVDLTSIRPGGGGGVERVAVGIVSALGRIGLPLHCLVSLQSLPDWKRELPESIHSSISETKVSMRSDSVWQKYLRRIMPQPLRESAFVGMVRQRRSKAVASAGKSSVVWFPFHRVYASAMNSVVTVHDLRVFEKNLASPMDQKIIRANVANAKALICSWPHPYGQLREMFPEASEKIFLIPLPVLNPGEKFVRKISPRSQVTLFYPAFVTPHKNHEVLIRALAILPEAKLVCTGAETEQHVKFLQSLARQLGVDNRIEWHGYVSKERLEEAYRNAHILVMPTRWEAASGPVFEAVARQLPFVASDIAPLRTQVDTLRLEGAFFDPDDPLDLARSLTNCIENYDSRVAALDTAAEAIRKRDWDATGGDYARVFAWVAGTATKPTDLGGNTA